MIPLFGCLWGNTGDGKVRHYCEQFTPITLPCTAGAVTTLAEGQDPAAITARTVSTSSASTTTVYWVNRSQGTVVSCPFACNNAPTTIATGQDQPRSIAVDSTAVYWATATGVFKCPLAGCVGQPIPLVTKHAPVQIAVESPNIFFTDAHCGAVMKCPITGCGSSPTPLATGLNGPRQLALSGSHVYWTNADGRVLATAR